MGNVLLLGVASTTTAHLANRLLSLPGVAVAEVDDPKAVIDQFGSPTSRSRVDLLVVGSRVEDPVPLIERALLLQPTLVVVLLQGDGGERTGINPPLNELVLTLPEGDPEAVIKAVTPMIHGLSTMVQQQRMLAETSCVLGQSIDYETTLSNLAKLLVPALADWCTIDLVNEEQSLISVVMFHTDPTKISFVQDLRRQYPIRLTDRLGVPNVIRTGRLELHPDVSDELLQQFAVDAQHLRVLRSLKVCSAAVVPLVARGRTLGAMTLASETTRRYDAQDLPLLEELGRRCGMAVDNARLYHQAQRELADRKEVEQTLRQSERWLRQAIQGMAVAVYATDAEGCILSYNDKAVALWGREPAKHDTYERFCGALQMFRPDGTPMRHNECPLAEVLRTHRPAPPAEVVVLRPDGSRAMALVNPAPVFDDQGELIGAINCMIEITERRQVEQALRESENRFRAIFDQVPVGIAQLDLKNRFQIANDRFCQIVGYSHDELMQMTMPQITHPADLSTSVGHLQKLIAGELPNFTLEKRCICKDGQVTWVRVNASLIRDDAGRVQHVLSVLEDINERKRTAEALRQSEERFRLMIESASDYAIFTIDMEARVTSWNSGAEHLLGYAEDEIVGESAHKIFTEEDCKLALPERELETAQRYGSAADERWHVRKDGSRFWSNGRMMAMRDAEGQVQGYIKILRDQTDEKHAQDQLKAHARQQKAVTRLGQQALEEIDPQTLLDEAVRVVAETLGNEMSAVLELLPGEKQLLVKAGVGWRPDVVGNVLVPASRNSQAGRTLASEKPVVLDDLQAETQFDGSVALNEHGVVSGMSVVIAGKNDRPYGILSTHTRQRHQFTADDVSFLQAVANILATTIQRQLDQDRLRQLNDTLEQRVVQRTSQLRALAAQLTQAEQRERRRLAQVLHDHLQQLLVASKMHLGMAHRQATNKLRPAIARAMELLDQSVAASRSLTVELSPPILYEGGLKAGLEWLTRWMQEKHKLRVALQAEHGSEPAAEDVRVFLFQAVRELLFNIVKHAETDHAHVRLHREDDHRLLVEVRDFGKGFIPTDVMRPQSGSEGFGLFSIHERLELLGGHMEIHSNPGQGTHTILHVPQHSLPQQIQAVGIGEQELPKPSYAAAARSKARDRAGPIRVLVADDHTIMCEGLVRLLGSQPGITVVGQAADGEEAVQRAQELHPDVIIMDVNMPKLNGIEATRRITAALPDLRVIGLSFHEERDMASAMYAAGADRYLAKDGPSERLIAAIRGEGGERKTTAA